MNHDTFEGRHTHDQEDFEQQLRNMLHNRATNYYPAGTKPPTWRERQATPTDHIKPWPSHKSSTANGRARKASTLAASVACVALACGLVANHIGGKSDSLSLAPKPAATHDSAEKNTGTFNAGANPTGTSGSDGNRPTAGEEVGKTTAAQRLPAHMKRTHEGPVRMVNYPIVCPESKPKPTGDTEFTISAEPIDPIVRCSELGLMGEVDPHFAYVVDINGAVQVSGRKLTGAKRIDRNVASSEQNSALPAGVTYNGVDLEVSYIVSKQNISDTSCQPFNTFKQHLAKRIQETAGGRWTVTTGKLRPNSEGNSHGRCHALYVDLHRRSIVVAESTPVASRTLTATKRHQEAEQILATVNSRCLSLSAAVNQTKTRAQLVASWNPDEPLIRVAVSNGRTCARAYQHPGEKPQFVLFGR